jgi:hypothetical protein
MMMTMRDSGCICHRRTPTITTGLHVWQRVLAQ